MTSKNSSLFVKRKFLPLFICQFLSSFSDNFIRTAFATLINFYAITLNSATQDIFLILAMALFILPFCIFSAWGGKLADKFKKTILIRWLKLINILVGGIAVIGFIFESNFILLLSIFLTGTEAAIFGPVKYSILPETLKKNELILGNGLIEGGTFVAILLGVILGSTIISNSSYSVYLTSFVIIFAALIAYIAALLIPVSDHVDNQVTISKDIYKETLECVSFIKKHHKAFLAVLGISWFWLIGGVFVAQMPSLTKKVFGGDESVFTLLLTVFSIGTGLGCIVCNKLLHSEVSTKYVPISMLIMSFFFIDLWWTCGIFKKVEDLGGIHYFLSHLEGIRASFDIFMISLMGGIYVVPLYAILQLEIDQSHRSQAIAANNIFNSLFIIIASMITMLFTWMRMSADNLLLLLVIANFLTAIYICKILPDTVIKNIFQWTLKLMFRVEVIGMENYYKAGDRVLVIANHASFIDPLLISTFLPDRFIYAIDAQHARRWWLKPFLSLLKAIPVDPSHPMATKTLIDKLKANKKVVIFPEGRLTVTGSLMKVYEGPGMIADKADATLLPVRLDGPQFTVFSRLHGKLPLRFFPKITIHILEPKKLCSPKSTIGRDRRHEIGNDLYNIMSEMMFCGNQQTTTLFENLIQAKKQFGRSTVIVTDANKNSLSYGRLITASFILGKKMLSNTSLKEYVGIMLPNVVSVIPAFFGLLLHGRTPAMLNFSTGVRNIISSCKATNLKVIYTSSMFVEKANLSSIIEVIKYMGINVIYLEDIRTEISVIDKIKGLYHSFFPSRYFRKYFKKFEKVSLPLFDDPAVVLYTSGSEGLPKGVVLSHSNILSNIKQIASRVDFTPNDKLFNALPIFHSFGLTAGVILPLLFGIKVFLYPSPLHYRIIPEMVYGVNATFFFATDTFLAGYAKYAHQYDFFSIRYVFAGAEKLKDETKKIWMEKFGIRILEGYGTTETSPVISVNTTMYCKADSVGKMMPGMSYKLEKVDGINRGGKLIVSGPNLMLGYLRESAPGILEKPSYAFDGDIHEGWYDTGDVVDIDEENFITILDRVKRFAKIGGEMISLALVEKVINDIWPDHSHAAINVSDDKKGETILLFTTNQNAGKEIILSHLNREGFSELFLPKHIYCIDELPVLGAGKIDYVLLKEKALMGKL